MYGKVFRSLWEGSLIARPDEQLVFIFLLVHSDPAGHVEVCREFISRLTGLGKERVDTALEILMAPDPDSRNPAEEGRRLLPIDDRNWGWRIVNYPYYRKLRDSEMIRFQTAERVRRHREAKKNVTLGNASLRQEEVEVEEEEEKKADSYESARVTDPKREENPAKSNSPRMIGGTTPENGGKIAADTPNCPSPRMIPNLDAAKGIGASLARDKSLTKPRRLGHLTPQEAAKMVFDLVQDQPDPTQRTCIRLGQRLVKAGKDPKVVIGCIEHFLSHPTEIRNPYAYYANGSEGLAWVEQRVRLGAFDAEHAATKEKREDA